MDLRYVAEKLGINKSESGRFFCPRHDNESPDLCIEQDRFYCFGKGSYDGGYSPITLVMHVENCSKTEAIERLRELYPKRFSKEDEEEANRRMKATKVLEKATELAHKALLNDRKKIKQRLKEDRNFSEKLIQDVKIGFFTSEVVQKLEESFDRQALLDSGLFTKDDDRDRIYTPMKSRIVFPYIFGGKTHYMIGRKIKEDHGAKYKKIRSTEYNRHILLSYEAERGSDTLIITEGVTDAISVYHAGYNVISPVTVKFRDEDREKILRKVRNYEEVYLCMDADEAGEKGAKETAEDLVKEGINPRIVNLPEEYDMDDWTTENGYDIEELLEEAEGFLEKKLEEIEEFEKNKERKKQSEAVKEFLKLISDWGPIDQNPWLKDLPGKKRGLEKKIKEYKQEYTERTEITEQTEQGYADNIGRVCESSDIDLEVFKDEKPPEKRRLSGIVDDTFFMVTWFFARGRYRRVILTSEGEVKPIKNKLKEVKEKLSDEERKKMSKERKRALNYDYVELNGKEIQFKHRIPEKPMEGLKTPTNDIIEYIKNPDKLPDRSKVFQCLIDFLKDYWDHYHDEWYDVMGAFVIHTYLIVALTYTIYIYLYGEPDTGKTTLQKTLSYLEYNGFNAGNATPVTVARCSHSYQASINLEETDKVSNERKQMIQGLFNTGQRKDGVYPITDTDFTDLADQIKQIYTFNPKTFSANEVYGWTESFKSRCLFCKCVRAGDKELMNPDKIEVERKEEIEDLRNQITAYCLFNWRYILDAIEEEIEDMSATGRGAEKLAVFSGIVKFFKGDERAEEVKERLVESQEVSGFNKLKERVRLLLEYLIKELNQTESSTIEPRFKDIAEYVNEETNTAPDDEYAITSRGIGSKLRKYDLIRGKDDKKKDSKGLTRLVLDTDRLIDTLNRYNLIDDLEIELEDEGQGEEDTHTKEGNDENNSPSSPFAPSKGDERTSVKEANKRVIEKVRNTPGGIYKEELWDFVEDELKRDPEHLIEKQLVRTKGLLYLEGNKYKVAKGQEPKKEVDNKKEEVLIRVVEDIPEFVGYEKNYNLHKEDVLTIPESLGNTLISRGKAEKVNYENTT
ncbi:MAG: toprim domain-containing protein [archaeon]